MQNKNTLSIETKMHIHAALDLRLQDLIDSVRTSAEELDRAITDENKEYWQTSKDFWHERAVGVTKAKEEFRNFSYSYCRSEQPVL
jgi:hypothetical protein